MDYRAVAKNILAAEDAEQQVRDLLVEAHELKRTRSEAEAVAEVRGYREGAESVIKQLRAYAINVTISEPK